MTWPQMPSVAELLARGEALNQAAEQSRARARAKLEAVVAGLDGPVGSSEPEPSLTGHERPERTRRVTAVADPEPFVPLPRRTTPGGPYGPAVVAKFREAARQKGGW